MQSHRHSSEWSQQQDEAQHPHRALAALCCPPAMGDKRWPWLEVHGKGGSHWAMEGAAMRLGGWEGMPSLPAPKHHPNVSILLVGLYWVQGVN